MHLSVENSGTAITNLLSTGQVITVPIAHNEGNYFADAETMASLEKNGQIVFRYCTADGDVTEAANPNGSLGNIAGIMNEKGNVLGMMPHPERCAEAILGHVDGAQIFQSLISSFTTQAAV
mgnify:CR=1 FL=1